MAQGGQAKMDVEELVFFWRAVKLTMRAAGAFGGDPRSVIT
jgi:hypothetical protein